MAILLSRMLDVFGKRATLSSRPASISFDLLCFPTDSADRFIDTNGNITISPTDLTWRRL